MKFSCTKCELEKDAGQFWYRFRGGKRTRIPTCKICSTETVLTWKQKNPEKARATARKWQKANYEKVSRQIRNAELKRKYGITIAQRDAMLERQGGVCAICKTDDHQGRGWCVDHDHGTNQVRQILCSPCNLMLGYARDNPSILRAGAAYIEAHFNVD